MDKNVQDTMTTQQFNMWVIQMARNFFNYSKKNKHIQYSVCRADRCVVIFNTKTCEIARSRCHPSDTFDSQIGIATAFAKYIGSKIPKIVDYVNINQVKEGQTVILPQGTYILVGRVSIKGDVVTVLCNNLRAGETKALVNANEMVRVIR